VPFSSAVVSKESFPADMFREWTFAGGRPGACHTNDVSFNVREAAALFCLLGGEGTAPPRIAAILAFFLFFNSPSGHRWQ